MVKTKRESEEVIINLCRDSQMVREALKDLSINDKVLDFTGAVIQNENVLHLAEVDPDGALESKAIEKYMDFVGKLSRAEISGSYIRQITLLKRPLFWFTPLAQKHASYHWGKDLWMLYILLLNKSELFVGDNTLLIPVNNSHVRDLIYDLFNTAQIKVKRIILLGKPAISLTGPRFMLNCFKGLLKAISWRRKLKRINTSGISKKNIFVTKVPWSQNGKRESDPDLGEIYDYSKSEAGCIYVPFFTRYDNCGFDFQLTDKKYLFSFPTIGQLWKLFCDQLKVWRELRKKCTATVKLDGFPDIPFTLVREELLLGINHLYFLNYIWLQNYFKQLEDVSSIFYSDEFYTTGRIISSALEFSANKKLTGYGVQHALIFKNHTVYTIGDSELNSQISEDDKLPAPNYFIVWGDYFKRLFLSFNSQNSGYVITAGNLKYIKLQKSKNDNPLLSDDKRLLWCTTLPEFFRAEYNLIEPVLKTLKNYKLTFRLHPIGHIKQEQIKELVCSEILSNSSFDSDENIFDDIARHDLVLTTIFSTTFFDALIMGRQACRIITGIAAVDEFTGLRIKNLYDIRDPLEFEEIFTGNGVRYEDRNLVHIGIFCYLKDEIWRRILN